MGSGAVAHNIWTLLEGHELGEIPDELPQLVINRNLAEVVRAAPGATLSLWGNCRRDTLKLPPVSFRVAGIVEFPFESPRERSAATDLDSFHTACGSEERNRADVLLVASRDGVRTEEAVAAIVATRTDLNAFSNGQLMRRFQRNDFSYFRQISFVLSVVTLLFAFLLIGTLLTVSVNQRLAEVAALRALGFSRYRIVADLICESFLLVGAGGLLALPLGGVVAIWLDGILKQMPGIPLRIHFFVLEPRSIVLHVVLLAATGLLAAAYPVWLAARLPIAGTLRKEVVS
jgi:putative ABC transport system permease protein